MFINDQSVGFMPTCHFQTWYLAEYLGVLYINQLVSF